MVINPDERINNETTNLDVPATTASSLESFGNKKKRALLHRHACHTPFTGRCWIGSHRHNRIIGTTYISIYSFANANNAQTTHFPTISRRQMQTKSRKTCKKPMPTYS